MPIKFNYSNSEDYSGFITELEKTDFVVSKQTHDDQNTLLDIKPKLYQVSDIVKNTILSNEDNMSEIKQGNLDWSEVEELGVKVTYAEVGKDAPILKSKDTILLDFVELQVNYSVNKIAIIPESKIVRFVEEQVHDLVILSNKSSEYFGQEVSLNKKVLILWPILLIDKNDKQQLASVSIEFYEHGMAILKISYPIENQTSYPLTQNKIDLYYKDCYYNIDINDNVPIADFDYKRVSSNSIHSVTGIILHWLSENSNGFIHSEEQQIIQLNQLKPQNINIRQIKKEEKEAVFRIVNGPVNDGIKWHPERNIMWDEHSWGKGHRRYLFSTMGKCVAIAGENIDSSLPKEIPKEEVNAIIKRSLLMDVEDAYKVMLLNRLNSVNFLLKQGKDDFHNLKLLKEDYYFSENYILGLLDYSFGTVRDLYSTIESVTSDYLNKESLEKRFKNNQTVLSNRHQEKIRKENDRLSILGLLITVLVSFPAIYETLNIFQKELVTVDIPYVNVLELAIFFELILLWLLFYWYRNKK